MITEVNDFLQEAARDLRAGHLLDAPSIRVAAEAIQERLEEVCARAEERPAPRGLETVDDALFEAAELLSEAVSLLLLAVEEDIPELGTIVSERAQDALDTLRALEQTVETHTTMLAEEMPLLE